MNRRFFALVMGFTMLVAACSSGNTSSGETTPAVEIPYTPPAATPVGFDPERCDPMPGQGLILEDAVIQPGSRPRAAYDVQSANYPEYWFIAAVLDVEGYDDTGPVGIWVAHSFDTEYMVPSGIAPYNSVAEEFFRTDWIGPRLTLDPASVPDDIEGPAVAEACSLLAERDNPDGPIESEIVKPGAWFLRDNGNPSMIAEVDGYTQKCIEVPFEPAAAGSSEYVLLGWPERTGPPFLDIKTNRCVEYMTTSPTQQPSLVMESVPELYRRLIED